MSTYVISAESNQDAGERQYLLSDAASSQRSTNISSIDDGQANYRVYGARWFLLATVCVLNISNSMMWVSFSPVADFTSKFYQVDDSLVNWLSLDYMVVCIPVGLVATWLLDTWGLRFGLILSSWFNLIGALVRVVSAVGVVPVTYRYAVLITGQTLAACAQPVMLFSPTKVAALWFAENQRATANMIASVSNPIGILLANVLSPLLVQTADQITQMLWVFCVPAALGMLMATFGVCSSVPPTPPTVSAAEESESFLSGLKMVLRIRAYWILAACFGAGIALFSCLSTLLEQILCPRGYDDEFAGMCGALMIGFGIIGAGAAGAYIDKTKKFEEVMKIGFAGAALSAVALAMVSRYPHQPVLVAVCAALFGFFGMAVYPVAFELSVETTYPVAEATAAGLILISGQIQGILYTIVMQYLAVPLTGAEVYEEKCSMGLHKTVPLNFTTSNLVFAGVSVLSACVFISFFKTEYHRLEAERQREAERLLSINAQRYLTPSMT